MYSECNRKMKRFQSFLVDKRIVVGRFTKTIYTIRYGCDAMYPGSFDILGQPASLNSSGMDPSSKRLISPRPGT